ncbi:unnamed protein product, partial [Tenebrio molitor]
GTITLHFLSKIHDETQKKLVVRQNCQPNLKFFSVSQTKWFL